MNRALYALEKSPIHERRGLVGRAPLPRPDSPIPFSHNAPLCPPAATSRALAPRAAATKQNSSPKEVAF